MNAAELTQWAQDAIAPVQGNRWGTGFVFAVTDRTAFVLTANHLIADAGHHRCASDGQSYTVPYGRVANQVEEWKPRLVRAGPSQKYTDKECELFSELMHPAAEQGRTAEEMYPLPSGPFLQATKTGFCRSCRSATPFTSMMRLLSVLVAHQSLAFRTHSCMITGAA